MNEMNKISMAVHIMDELTDIIDDAIQSMKDAGELKDNGSMLVGMLWSLSVTNQFVDHFNIDVNDLDDIMEYIKEKI